MKESVNREQTMKKEIRNPNHPKKGQSIKVEPIRRMKDINAIKNILSGNHRNLLLFTMGINSGLRICDLLKIRVKDVSGIKPGRSCIISKSKNGKKNILMMNNTMYDALRNYLEKARPDKNDYLFASQKTKDKPLSIQAINALVKKWTRAVNLNGNYGAITLRKTFGYIQRTEYGAGLEALASKFNHSSSRMTMKFLDLDFEEEGDVLVNEI